MDILMVTNTYPPARNGVAAWTGSIVRELRRRGDAVEVLTFAHDRRGPGDGTIHEVPALAGVDVDFKVAPVLRLPGSLSGRRFDVVHVHHPVFLGPTGVAFARATGAASVFSCHSRHTDYFGEYFLGLGRLYEPFFVKRFARLVNGCDVALAPSSAIERWLRECGVTASIEAVGVPADTERVPVLPRDDARRILGLSGDVRLALYVGRITEEKRVEELVREFAVAARLLPSARLALAGRGGREGAVKEKAFALRISDRVALLGELGGDDLGVWYSAADIVVSASPSEGGPLTVVEAMQAGVPSVSYDAPGFEDRVTDGVNGLLAQRRPGALGEAIVRALTDERLRGRMSAAAAALAPTHTSAGVAAQLAQVYARLTR